ncbi:MAG: hypothetical protein FWE07_06380 [Turicibacter sp.]|nr:hypothetical protein [Turicibacter sp.]
MSRLEVYNVGEEVERVDIDDQKRTNIEKIFDRLLGEDSKLKHSRIVCTLASDQQRSDVLLYDYDKAKEDFSLEIFASSLLQAEMRKSGDGRKKSIPAGHLFISQAASRLLLLKLEGTEGIDLGTYEIKPQLGTDAGYYKICIFENDFDNIIIVDKNTKAAKYWVESFLDLSRQRDDALNTKELIALIKSDELFSDDIVSAPNIKQIRLATEDYLFENKVFDKEKLIHTLNQLELIEVKDEDEFFSDQAALIDSEFTVSESELNREYKKTLQVSEDTKLSTNNFVKLRRENGIKIEDGWLSVRVESAFLENIKNELGD